MKRIKATIADTLMCWDCCRFRWERAHLRNCTLERWAGR